MTDEQSQLLSSIFDAVREIREWQKSQILRIDWLYGQSLRHDEAIEGLKIKASELDAKHNRLERSMHRPMLKTIHNNEDGIFLRIGLFIIENKGALAMIAFFGLGTIISIYNFFVVQIRKLPILPVPKVHVEDTR